MGHAFFAKQKKVGVLNGLEKETKAFGRSCFPYPESASVTR